jgi:hypothetical protein
VFFGSASSIIVKDKLLSVLLAISHIIIALVSYASLAVFVILFAFYGG